MPPPLRLGLEFIIICTIQLYATIEVASRSIFPTYASSAFVGQWKSSSSSGSFASSLYSKRSYSSDLDSAYEWLAEARALNKPSSQGRIRWFHPDSTSTSSNKEIKEIQKMPLYPLGAVHVPHSGENHTIINIDPKNVKMSVVCAFFTSSYVLHFTFCLL